MKKSKEIESFFEANMYVFNFKEQTESMIKNKTTSPKPAKKEKGKKKKEARKWPGEGTKEDFKALDYSKNESLSDAQTIIKPTTEDKEAKGTMRGEVKGLAVAELDIDSNS